MRKQQLRDDESGQVMLLVALLSLVLVALPATVINLGQAITNKIRLQTAADAAAMSATTWMARGSNLLQGLNGIHWDFNVAIADAMLACAYDADAEIAAHPWRFWVWWRAYRRIGRLERTQSGTARTIETTSATVATMTPYLAYFYANKIAEENSADLLDLSGIPVLGNVFKNLQKYIRPVQGLVNIRTWTLSPSMWPPNAMQIAKKQRAPGNYTTPYYMTWKRPFLPCLTYAHRPGWHNSYWVSTDNIINEKTVTFVVSHESKRAFMLNKLLNMKKDNSNLLGPSYAIGSARVLGDQLYPAGQRNTKYWCFSFWFYSAVISYDPPVFGIPWRWIGWGRYHYGGNFKAEMVPVEIMGQKGRNFMLFH